MQTKEQLAHALIVAQRRIAELEASESARQHTREVADTLIQTGRDLSNALDFTQAIDCITTTVLRLLCVRRTALFRFDPTTNSLVCVTVAGEGGDGTWLGQSTPVDAGIVGWSFLEGTPMWTADILSDARMSISERIHKRLLEEDLRSVAVIPLLTRDKTLGALLLGDTAGREFSKPDLRLLSAVADQAAMTLENIQLSENVAQRVARLRTLTRLNQLVSSSLEMDVVLNEIAQAAATLMQTPFVSFWIADTAAQTLQLRASSNENIGTGIAVNHLRFDQGIAGWVATHRQALNVPDVFAFGKVVTPDWWQTHDFSSMFAVPILFGDELLAVLTFMDRKPFLFTLDDQNLLESFMSQAAMAFHNARFYQKSTTRQKSLSTLVDVAQRLTSGLELSVVLQAISEATALLFEAEAGFRLVEGDYLVGVGDTPFIHSAMIRKRLKLGESISGQVAASGQPFMTADATSEPAFIPDHQAVALALGHGPMLTVPVRLGTGSLGVLTIVRKQGFPIFNQDDLQVAETLADQAAIAIENARLFDAIQQQASQLEQANAVLQGEVLERQKTEVALRASEERFAKAFQASPEALIITALDGRYIAVNESYVRLSGYSREELIGRTSTELRRWVDTGERDRVARVIQEQGRVNDLEVRFRTKAGKTHLAHLSLELIELDNEPCLLCTTRDISETKRIEAHLRQTQKMEAIGTLAGGIAHDFNNILGAILGYTELATYIVPEDSPAQSNLREVLTAGKRARDLVLQILAFSRQHEPERQPVQLQLLVKEALILLYASLPSTIEIQQYIKQDTGLVLADPTQIHQVLINLYSNAEHAMRFTGGILEIRLEEVMVDDAFAAGHEALQAGPHLRLTVRDTGDGIPPEVAERIFEPFFTTKDVGEGTGMGLAMVHGIVTSHGGTITATSTPQQGTTFEVYLPRIDGVTADTTDAEKPIPSGAGRILLVDDETTLANLGRALLERLGHEAVVCTDSRDALQTFQSAPQGFDLVITDQTMPHMTGEASTRELRRLRPDIPVILCTGFSHTMTPEKAQALGIDAFLMKPLELGELARTIRQVLGARPPKPLTY